MHAIPVEATVSQLLPVVCDLHKDKIPNIRLNVAKSLSAAIDVCKAQRCEQTETAGAGHVKCHPSRA